MSAFRCKRHNKIAFGNEEVAMAELVRIEALPMEKWRSKKPVRVYKDERCNFWHLTSEESPGGKV